MNNKTAVKILAVAAVMISSLPMASCHDANARKEKAESSMGETRPDAALNKLMRSLAEGDAPGFAALCVYPIVRPYPLKSINDSVSMVDYFPIIINDSIRDYFRKSKLEDWENYGWRGWSIGEGRPIWYDDGVQFIDYVSPAETGLQRILAREEIMSLSPEFRGGWTPVMTLLQEDGDRIFRIDVKNDSYRLMGFENADHMRSIPSILMIGSVLTEGSAGYRTYAFKDSTGNEAEYMPDGEPPVKIIIRRHELKNEDIYEVRQSYWRDILK